MPRNVLAAKTTDQLVMEFTLRNMDPHDSPTKLYSTTEIWEELRNRVSFEEASRLYEEAKATLALMG